MSMSTTTTITPSPAMFAKKKPAIARVIAADITPSDPGRIVRPGTRKEYTGETHDGVLKAKALREGMVVRSFLHGQPKGADKTVEYARKLNKIDEIKHLLEEGAITLREGEEAQPGAFVEVTFSSPHPTMYVRAAYRFHSVALAGTPLATDVPAFVAYQEA